MADLSGRRFGMLQVIDIDVAKPYCKKSYTCLCDCGKVCTRLEASLKAAARDNRIPSCGCYTAKNLRPGDAELCSKAGSSRKNSFVDGCNVQVTFRKGTFVTNTSGCQGVAWSKTANKWHVYIGYQRYRPNLGFYTSYDTAVKVRKAAEEAIRSHTFEDFYYSIRGCRLGEKQHRLAKHN